MGHSFGSAVERVAALKSNRHTTGSGELNDFLYAGTSDSFRYQNLVQRPARAQRFSYWVYSG